MVYLHRIYTGSGDAGETSLGDGSRVPKTHARVVACGGVDEFNSVLGLVAEVDPPEALAKRLRQIQNDLFDVGADLCVPQSADEASREHLPLRVTAEQATRLERWIDEANESLQPLTSFVLPGGTPLAARLHHARSVCRRAEVAVVALAAAETVNTQVLIYLNRLSDLLFVWARTANDNGQRDVLWVPGANR